MAHGAPVPEEEYVIEIKGLVNTVGANTILHRDLNLLVRRDEVMSLVGGSGSGKTQLVRVILGLKRPKAGTVRVFGVSWEDSSAKKVRDARRRMGMLFQNGALYSALTVYDNVAFPLRERGGLSERKSAASCTPSSRRWSSSPATASCCRPISRVGW